MRSSYHFRLFVLSCTVGVGRVSADVTPNGVQANLEAKIAALEAQIADTRAKLDLAAAKLQ